MMKISNLTDSELHSAIDSLRCELKRRGQRRLERARNEQYDAELLQADQNLAEYEAEYTKSNAELFAEFKRLTRNYDIHVQQADKHKALAEETAEAMRDIQDKLSVATQTLNRIKSRREQIHKIWIQNHPAY